MIENSKTEDFDAFPGSVLEMGCADHGMFVHFRLGLCCLTKSRKESVDVFRGDPDLMEQICESISEAVKALCDAAELMVTAHQRMAMVADDVRRLRAN